MAQPCNADTSTDWADALNHSTQQLLAMIDSSERLLASGEKRERDEAQSDSVEAAEMFRAVIVEICDLRPRVYAAQKATRAGGTRADRADRMRHLSTTRSLLGDVYSRAEELHENIRPLSLTPPVPDVSWKRRAQDLMKQKVAASKESGTELTKRPQRVQKGLLVS